MGQNQAAEHDDGVRKLFVSVGVNFTGGGKDTYAYVSTYGPPKRLLKRLGGQPRGAKLVAPLPGGWRRE